MKFKRINVDTVRCFISSEELAANGLTVNDFLTSDGRCEEFIRKVVTLAQQEVDFKVYGGPMSIQVAALSEGTIALTFSEKQDMGIVEFLEALKSAVETIKKQADPESVLGEVPVLESDEKEYLFYAESFDDLMDLARNIAPRKIPECVLYKEPHEKGYYLIAYRRDTGVNMADFFSSAIEFLQVMTDDEAKISYIKEHFPCILKEDALGKLLLIK